MKVFPCACVFPELYFLRRELNIERCQWEIWIWERRKTDTVYHYCMCYMCYVSNRAAVEAKEVWDALAAAEADDALAGVGMEGVEPSSEA